MVETNSSQQVGKQTQRVCPQCGLSKSISEFSQFYTQPLLLKENAAPLKSPICNSCSEDIAEYFEL